METVVYNFHDESGETVGKLDLRAGDDAKEVEWKEVTSGLDLYANHCSFIEAIAKKFDCFW
jgi:ADP-ribose pyrophosphatase